MALSAETRAAIQERFPAYAYLLDEPSMGPVLERAINEGWPESRFIANVYATDYYRTRTEAQRQIDALRALDPAQARQIEGEKYGTVKDFAGKMGLILSHEEFSYLAAAMLGAGTSIDDPIERIGMLNFLRANPAKISNTGAIYQAAQAVDNLYRTQFFYSGDWNQSLMAGLEIALGYNTEDNVKQNAAEWFSSITPHLADRLKAGETYADIVNPYRDIIAKELELGDLNAVDMVGTPQWRWLLGVPDEGGVQRMPTQQEVVEGARKDTRWKGTIGATALGADLVTRMAQKFGTTT